MAKTDQRAPRVVTASEWQRLVHAAASGPGGFIVESGRLIGGERYGTLNLAPYRIIDDPVEETPATDGDA